MFCKEGHLRQSLVDGSEPRDSDGDSDEDVPLQHEGTHMQRIRQFRTRHVLLAMAFANVGLASSWAGNVFHVHSQACAGQDMRTTICGGLMQMAHCIDMIRQALKCNIHTRLLGQVWVNPKDPQPVYDSRNTYVSRDS
ncbi:hypothetical protein S40285_10641 [Stachybotrys chlorohalonatus IBT 40285]|uniref:Uncharacterized protein n=1 Tax=Stachybotrys chlorohalonatus (strain IBT 40285) TaxID=1283841 RepID=A0A084QQL4_STAC4|nr:hypothetical protein S40285_10641 [Stachybotrys chlorohalonata IBT 40285]